MDIWRHIQKLKRRSKRDVSTTGEVAWFRAMERSSAKRAREDAAKRRAGRD